MTQMKKNDRTFISNEWKDVSTNDLFKDKKSCNIFFT